MTNMPVKTLSPALQLVTAAAAAPRKTRSQIHDAVTSAIEGHLSFEPGDCNAINRMADSYETANEHRYATAVECGATSFVLAYEADHKFEPWLWPCCLIGNRDGKQKFGRLYHGASLWFVRNGEARLWQVSGWTRDTLSLSITTHSEHSQHVCQKCDRTVYDSKPAKVLARLTFTRAEWAAHVDRLRGYQQLGLLDDGRLVAWELTPYTGRTGPDEQAWTGQFLIAWNRPEYGQANLADGLVLKSRGFVSHGTTLRNTRGIRAEKLRWWESQVRESMAYGHRMDFDEPLPVSALQEAVARTKYRNFNPLPAIARNRLRGETVTIRQLLIGSTDLAKDASLIDDLLSSVERNDSEQERRQRETARIAAQEELLTQHRETTVRVADSLAIGNCPMGTRAWLQEFFPELLTKSLSVEPDHDRLKSGLIKIKRTLTVGQVLDLPPQAAREALPVLLHAIARV